MKLNHEGEYICDCENWEEPVLYPVAELIRCKDCMHNGSEDTDCPAHGWSKSCTDFCSWAERREE